VLGMKWHLPHHAIIESAIQLRQYGTVFMKRPTKVSPDAAPLLLALATILLGDQHLLYPAVDLRTLLPHEIDPFAGFQELADLVWFQTLGVLHSYLHSPAARLLDTSYFQDHLVLETSLVSGSSCTG